MYTIPGEETWEVIINKGVTNAGVDGYKESQDVVRFKTEAMKMKEIEEQKDALEQEKAEIERLK